MNKKLLLASFLTVSMAFICQGAEKEKVKKEHELFQKLRRAVNEGMLGADLSKHEQRELLQQKISEKLQHGDKRDSLKARRVLQGLQYKIKQDENPKPGRTLIF